MEQNLIDIYDLIEHAIDNAFEGKMNLKFYDYLKESKIKKGKIIYGKARPGEVKRFISNSDKMKSFGWKPKVNLEEGLEKYINWRKSL